MPWPHETADEFLAALQHTTGRTGFRVELVEKDYYCSVVLQVLAGAGGSLCFKGGTSLNKIHAGFYRLSEDLDFTLAVADLSSRAARGRAAEPFKKLLKEDSILAPGLTVRVPLSGHNQSRQYVGEVSYPSAVTGLPGTIQIDIGVREALVDPPTVGQVETLLADPFAARPSLPPFPTTCLSREETYAEKVRAALTRLQPAIRDLYDLWFARRRESLPDTDGFLTKVRTKLAAVGDLWVPIEGERERQFRRQLSTELEPVLRPDDFAAFRFDEAFQIVREFEQRLDLCAGRGARG